MRGLLATTLALFFCGWSWGDGLIRDGLGARSAGRAGTNLGFADTGTILHDNPGGVVNFAGTSLLEAGVDLVFGDIDYQKAGGAAASDEDPIPLGDVTLLKRINEDLAWGLGLYTPGGFATDYKMAGPPPFFGDRKYKSFGSLGRILPGLSWRVNERLSMGVTAGVGISHVELEGPYTLQTGALRGVPTLIDVQGTGAAFSWSVGLQYQIGSGTTVGATYQSENRFELDGSTKAVVPGLGESAFDSELEITWPRSIGVGLRHAFCDHKIGSIDVIYYNWANALDDAGLFLKNPTNPAFAALGPVVEEQIPLRWRDTVSVRLGFERHFSDSNVLRWGYAYHRNPIRAEYLTPYLVTTLEHTLAVGYGTTIFGHEVDFGYQFMFAPELRVGTSQIAGGEYDNSEVRTQAHFFYVSLLRRS